MVNINVILGDQKKIVCGVVPKGSVLGPIFLFYISIVFVI